MSNPKKAMRTDDESEWKRRRKEAKRKRKAFKRLVKEKMKEYIDEAEHQDGIEYWLQFDTVSETLDDFMMYNNIGVTGTEEEAHPEDLPLDFGKDDVESYAEVAMPDMVVHRVQMVDAETGDPMWRVTYENPDNTKGLTLPHCEVRVSASTRQHARILAPRVVGTSINVISVEPVYVPDTARETADHLRAGSSGDDAASESLDLDEPPATYQPDGK